MAGRRIKNTVKSELASLGVDTPVVASLANSYASYLATREEYAMQWYEGACTQFGPNELAAFQQEYAKLCKAIVSGADVAPGPTPEDVTGKTVDFTAEVVLDDKPIGKSFGSVIAQADRYFNRITTSSVGADRARRPNSPDFLPSSRRSWRNLGAEDKRLPPEQLLES